MATAVTEGQSASFTVVATGTAPLTYAWRRNGSTIAGATAATYTLAATTLADNAASFAVVVSNSAGSVTSSAVALAVNALTVTPTITAQPAAAALSAGGTATFTVAVSGAPAPSVQWQIAGGADLADGAGSGALAGATIAGATTPTLTLTNVPQSANGVQLAARASNSAGTVTSGSAALTVNSAGVVISAAAGGTVRVPGDALTIEIAPGALTADATFMLTPATTIADFAPDFREVPGALWNLSISGGQLLPGRTAKVRFRVSPAALPAGTVRALSVPVQRASSPAGGDGSGWSVVRCEGGGPQVVAVEPGESDFAGSVTFCEGNGRRTEALGLVVNRAPVPGTAVYEVALHTRLSGMRSWDWVGVDQAGQVTLSLCVGVASPTDASQTVCARNLARVAADGTVAVNARVSGGEPTSTNVELWPRVRGHTLASNGALAGLWRGGVSGQQRARVEAYGVAPFGSGRLLTQRQFARTFAVDVAASDDVPVRGLDFAPSGELVTHERFELNLYGNGASSPRLSRRFEINFPGRPDGGGDGAGTSDLPLVLDSAGNVYKTGGNSVNDSATGFCFPLCPAIYKYSAIGAPLWYRVLGPSGGLFGPTVAVDGQGRPVVRFQSPQNRDVVVRLDPATGAITGSVDLGPTASSTSRNTLTFDSAGNTYAGLGRFLVRIPPDFAAAGVVQLEFGQGQTGDYQAIGADAVGNAYGIFTRSPGRADAEFRLLKARYP
ncbi:MAG: immunoglobulin domain-containing protein [Burkholderiaceae bacterium]|nr:immunoglobulin domain-containing protein [Burkholderiaceae bacterium]